MLPPKKTILHAALRILRKKTLNLNFGCSAGNSAEEKNIYPPMGGYLDE